ncbi:Site-specific recombinase XerD [Cnuella takakiae]|uniref:Site-specific recombinase XerD n=1 Tax=Cnuella takakiae TaxID=1302690 RepID=A0A1M4VR92_9BACT|nr:tyrosine-type recombinase/integrase [Cnuella takakiae]OLY92524.1 hypothetical protein BUE76_11950 [Cnuella takakiae]SHE71536.1 Site-specific recombinase XerD [Cnuella takakiae]
MQPKKLFLSGGCWCSYPSVTPDNWKTAKASIRKAWRIHYRFYDPKITDPKTGKVKPKQVTIQSMNKYTDLKQRQAATQFLIEDTVHMLTRESYHPVKKEVATPALVITIPRDTPFDTALLMAMEKMQGADSTRRDLRCVLNYVLPALRHFRMDIMEIQEVESHHIVALLDGMQKEWKVINRLGEKTYVNKAKPGPFSDAKYNRYRANLQLAFKVLKKYGAIKHNPITGEDVEERKVAKEVRQVLTKEERKRIKTHLAEENPVFGRFVEIFFHSSGRRTELLAMKVKDVDLINQTYRVLVKKGGLYKYQERTIKNIAVPLWREQIKEALPDDYVFSRRLVPGPAMIREDQIDKRWRRWVKSPLGITSDFYTLKHGNTSELVDSLGDEAAAQQAGHTSTAMVVSIYDHSRKQREHERLKRANNAF